MRWSTPQFSWKKFTNTKVKLAQSLLFQEMITETHLASLVILTMLQQVKNPQDSDAALHMTCTLRIDLPASKKSTLILNTHIVKKTDAQGLIIPALILLTHQALILKTWSNIQFQRANPKSSDKVQYPDQFAAQRSTKAVIWQKMAEIDSSLVNTIVILRHAPWHMLILLITDLRVKLLTQQRVIQLLSKTSNALSAVLLVSSSMMMAFYKLASLKWMKR